MGIAFIDRWLGRPGKSALSSTPDRGTSAPEDAESQFDLGRQFSDGENGDPDFGQAAVWYLKAAEQGHGLAQFSLGMIYGQGHGVRRDEIAAAMWLRKAAERGHAGAQYHLGVRQHHASKRMLPTEASERRIDAFKWLQLAVAQGYHGSESAREFVALNMTREEVGEGARRATTFSEAQPLVAAPH